MANDLNRCEFIGRLGKDPEQRYMPNGKAVTKFSIACGDDYKDQNGEKVQRTEWVTLVAFGRLAEVIAEYLRKGSKIYVAGKIHTNKWDKDGQTHYSTEIVVNQMQMLDSNRNGTNAPASEPASEPDMASAGDFDSDIPF